MKKTILLSILFFAVLLCAPSSPNGQPIYSQITTSGSVIPGDYCDSQTWNTLTSFRLDFDHSTDGSTACLSTGTELGVLTGATIATPPLASPGSGGNALYANATAEYITFSNTLPYFRSLYGELMFKFLIEGDNASTYYLINIIQTAAQDRLQIYVALGGRTAYIWEDNNNGGINENIGIDVDAYYGKWIQIHVKWDTTRCTDGTCDGAGEDEFCTRARVDANADGDFLDGGAEDWTAWACESSAVDMNTWAVEPTTDDFKFGIVSGTYDVYVYIDDVEISYNQPSW